MELTVQNVYGLLLRSNLLSVEEAKGMFARWQEEAKDGTANLARFAAWMVANKYLTEYQASMLARGHADGFFLGEHKILDRLGKGRMAGVYKAQHRLGQVVAIKVLPPSRAKDPMMLARFQREAKLAIRLRHPNIVRSFQMGTSKNLHFLVMEYLEGETLEEVLVRRKQFPPPEAVRLIYQALLGLQHIHEQGLVHRDLKPSNLMLVPPTVGDSTLRCTMKILDIGLGRVFFDETAENPDPGLTGEGVLLGTPDYMAPEQARDPRSTDVRADIYSLGCVLYHLLSGQTPFPDTNIISQMIKHATEPTRPLRDFNKEVPDGLQQIVNWMMAKEASGRYPTPERAAQALEVFLAAGNTPATSLDHDPKMQPYLTWVEEENSRTQPPSGHAVPVSSQPTAPFITVPVPAASAAKPPSSPIPIATPVASPGSGDKPRPRPDATPKRAESDKQTRAQRRAEEKRREKKKNTAAPVTGEKPAKRAATFDVELVEMPAEQANKKGTSEGLGLTRRDFVMFFAGVGTTVLAFLVGWAMAALMR